MFRSIIGVIVGYVVMALLVFVAFTLAYLSMGADGAFSPGTFEVSTRWIAVSFVLGFIAAAVGGYVCALIARGGKAPLALAGLVVVLGILVAIPVLLASEPIKDGLRAGDVPNMEAMMKAKTPGWVALLNPFVGAAGVLLGARMRRGADTR